MSGVHQVPPQYPAKYPKINDQNRKTFAGMVSALDEAVGNVTSAWKRNGLYNNSVIVFTTDVSESSALNHCVSLHVFIRQELHNDCMLSTKPCNRGPALAGP